MKELATWTETDFICKNLILNGLTDELYDYYSTMTTAKEVWDALQKKYDTEEVGLKKYTISSASTMKGFQEQSKAQNQGVLTGKPTHETKDRGGGKEA
ncbi:hypothetical protein E5676_scaffold11G00280 [Cucumis melo var. makuwa]|uniref:Zinc finger, CCHC-type n=1 Tax=Cucumis melo var. makuwa TaxID=1194695 RepID=A0A5D3BWD0_CUCMM|nr:hypothetical protein E5676_scaffold11G00280 [Cucumis melo var. makuwa]